MSNSKGNSNEFILTWKDIANAVSQELYNSLSKALIMIIEKLGISDSDIYDKERVERILPRLRRDGICGTIDTKSNHQHT